MLEGDTEATLAERVLELEHRLYPQALRLVAEGLEHDPEKWKPVFG